ncbi:glycosyltransferase, partial [Bacteroides cellulosilyticus]
MISVCIATHNGEKYIKKQLESILSQLSFSDEIVISDDGSTDQTIKLIQSFEDKRIKVLTYKQHFDYSKFYLSSYYYATANFYNALK